MQTQEQFFLANAVDGVLTDAQTMQMMSLPEGDTAAPAVESSEPPAAAVPTNNADDADPGKPVEPAPAAAAAPEAPKPVVLAKDGVHTIPFETLEQAREGEKHWRTLAEQAQQQLEALKTAPATGAAPAPADPAPQADTIKADFGDFSEEAIAKGVEKLVEAKVAAIVDAKVNTALAPVKEREAKTEAEEHLDAIHAKHPDMESIVPSREFAAWFHSQPKFAQPGIQAVLREGTADEVNELLDTYKASTGKTAPEPAPQVPTPVATAKAQAAAVIAKAQAAVPTSLSEIPAAGAVHHDQAEAMLEMSDAGLMNLFDGKSPEQIKAMLNRAI